MATSSKQKRQRMLHKSRPEPWQVMVFATMSAGKSTFVNSLVGSELLHCANEATTATLASIESTHRNSAPSVTCYAADQSVVAQSAKVCAQELKAWNADHNVRHIRVQVPFKGTYAYTNGLVLHDTPGPNNSQNAKHSELAFEALRHTKLHTICYVLNASQMGITDDQQLLAQLKKELENKPGTKVIFVLNKVDLLDVERGESLKNLLAHTHTYLEKNGFKQPRIVPTMSQTALLVKKYLCGDVLSFKERSHLRRSIEAAPTTTAPRLPPTLGLPAHIARKSLDALRRMKSSARLRQQISNHSNELGALMHLLAQSGIPTIETLLQHQHQQ
jgi:ribosome biogenesis GTPase A